MQAGNHAAENGARALLTRVGALVPEDVERPIGRDASPTVAVASLTDAVASLTNQDASLADGIANRTGNIVSPPLNGFEGIRDSRRP